MTWARLGWVAGAYLAGTLPSTWIVARTMNAKGLISAADRSAGETDAHILMAKHLGVGWTALAATVDVMKGMLFALAARNWGNLPDSWLSLVGVAVVVGHSFPFYQRDMAGRGVAATAGVFLALLPLEMVICGLVIVVGGALRNTGVATTFGLASVPAAAAGQGQPGPLVAMAAAIFVIIVIRRLEGLGEVIRAGVSPGRAALYRGVFDSSGPPAMRVWEEGREGRAR